MFSVVRPGFARRWLARTAALVPSQCALCHAWPAQRLCTACRARFVQSRPRCTGCARPIEGAARCGACLREPPPLDWCVAAVDYGHPWAGVVAQFKFGADPGWAAPLAALMRQAHGAREVLGRADLVLPVPLGAARLRERGYNQALLLARALAPAGPVLPALLLRPHDTPAQSSLGRRQRLANLRGAFMLEPLAVAAVTGRRALLVDDVTTTGATLHAAALALRAAGAAGVDALVLARTPLQQE